MGQGTEKWEDLPASYHNNAGSFSFADGHSEVHKWKDPRTAEPIFYKAWNTDPDYGNNLATPHDVDYEWVDDRLPYQ
jgi:prepilin-type processing-associated H-X9-DG protein